MTFSLLVIGILCAWSSCKADDNTTFLPEPTTTDSQNPYGEEISPYNLTKEQLRRMCGSYHIFGEDSYTRNVDYVHHKVDKIPPTFDAREKWPYCESIGTIRNQGFCGSCWAVASAAVISDRMCIENKGKIAPHISSEDILRCCRGCCRSPNPCAGGDMRKAMVYWVQYGVVSGGEFRSHEGCKPYSKESYYDRPTSVHCLRNCTNKDYNVSYEKDQQHGRKAYTISKEVEQIQTEIVLNGPVIASLRIYEDFFTYVTGVYIHKSGIYTNTEHAVKILGWGVDDDKQYWLAANSWGSSWGSDGFFKILRGENHCGIEGGIVAGTMTSASSSSSVKLLFCDCCVLFILFCTSLFIKL